MRAVVYRIRSVLRGRLLATVIMTLVVAIVCGVVLAFAAGARRTSTAPDRYTSDFGSSFDARIVEDDRSLPRDKEVAALPAVASVNAMTFVFGGLRDARVGDVGFTLIFSGSITPAGVRLVDGRLPDPANRTEFVATRNFVEQNHASIGESFDLATLTQQQAHDNGYDMSNPEGPSVKLVMVGVVDGASQLEDPTPVIVVSRALLDEPDMGVSETLMDVDLKAGEDLASLRAQLDTLPRSDTLSVEPSQLISDPVRNAIQAQARGLWLLAAVAAIAAIAVLGQLVTRQVRPSRDERRRLSAIGFTDGQVLAEAAGRAVVPIVVGSVLAAVLAIVPSGRFPSGFVRVVEPKPGILVDSVVLFGGCALLVLAITSWVLAALALSRWTTRPVRPSAIIEAVAGHAGTPTAVMGMRLAFTRRARERGSVRGSVIGVALAVAGVVAALTFGVSLDRLVDQSFRYGSNWDAELGNNGADALPDGLIDQLDTNPHVRSLTAFAGTTAREGDASLPVLGVQVVRGAGAPTVLEGQLPASEDEIAFGRVTARSIGAHVGDKITLAGATGTQVFRLTGIAVVPGLGANDGLGEGGIVTMAGMARLDSKAVPNSLAFRLDEDRAQFFRSIPALADVPPDPPFMPASIVNVARIRAIPFVLAAVLILLAILTVGHVMLTSIRGRRRDLAILRSLGADSGWIGRTVRWQATMLIALPLVIGVPTGVVAGRLVFIAFADSMGAVDGAAIPIARIATGVLATIVLANGIASIISRTSRRRESALLLQGE